MYLFLDSCIIIYSLEASSPFHEKVHNFLNTFHKKHANCQLVVSKLSILECRVKPLRDKNKRLLHQYDDFFNAPGLISLEIDSTVLELATALRVEYNIRTPDAIQAASCLTLPKKAYFLTSDQGFKKIGQLNTLFLN